MGDYKLVITKESKISILIYLKTLALIKSMQFFSIIKQLDDYCPNISMETIFMNTENSKTNELHKFVLNFSQR